MTRIQVCEGRWGAVLNTVVRVGFNEKVELGRRLEIRREPHWYLGTNHTWLREQVVEGPRQECPQFIKEQQGGQSGLSSHHALHLQHAHEPDLSISLRPQFRPFSPTLIHQIPVGFLTNVPPSSVSYTAPGTSFQKCRCQPLRSLSRLSPGLGDPLPPAPAHCSNLTACCVSPILEDPRSYMRFSPAPMLLLPPETPPPAWSAQPPSSLFFLRRHFLQKVSPDLPLSGLVPPPPRVSRKHCSNFIRHPQQSLCFLVSPLGFKQGWGMMLFLYPSTSHLAWHVRGPTCMLVELLNTYMNKIG